jgi:hypothetical protein
MVEGKAFTRLYTFAPNIEYIRKKRGEEGVQLVLEDMKRKGYVLELARINSDEWVPVEMRKEFLYSVRDVLGWDEARIRELGRAAPQISYAMKIYIGLFITVEKALSAPNLWVKHYSAGEVSLLLRGKGRGAMILKNFDLDPLFCIYIEGFLQGLGELTKSKNVRVKETRCTFRGDAVHEYTITWDP